MSRQVVLIAIAIFAILAGLVAHFTWQRDAGDDAASEPVAAEPTLSPAPLSGEELLAADLYFPGTGGGLQAERHELPMSADASERISTVVAALLAGPRGAGLQAPLPEGVSVRKVYLTEGGTAFLDLESVAGAPPPASGSLREMLTVYSLTNTVLLNFDEVKSLVLLWNGRQRTTFAGHLDTMRPLSANTDLIAPAP